MYSSKWLAWFALTESGCRLSRDVLKTSVCTFKCAIQVCVFFFLLHFKSNTAATRCSHMWSPQVGLIYRSETRNNVHVRLWRNFKLLFLELQPLVRLSPAQSKKKITNLQFSEDTSGTFCFWVFVACVQRKQLCTPLYETHLVLKKKKAPHLSKSAHPCRLSFELSCFFLRLYVTTWAAHDTAAAQVMQHHRVNSRFLTCFVIYFAVSVSTGTYVFACGPITSPYKQPLFVAIRSKQTHCQETSVQRRKYTFSVFFSTFSLTSLGEVEGSVCSRQRLVGSFYLKAELDGSRWIKFFYGLCLAVSFSFANRKSKVHPHSDMFPRFLLRDAPRRTWVTHSIFTFRLSSVPMLLGAYVLRHINQRTKSKWARNGSSSKSRGKKIRHCACANQSAAFFCV